MDSSGDDRCGSEAAHWIPSRPRYQPLVVVVVALTAGIALDRYGRPDAAFSTSDATPICFAVWWLVAAGCWVWWWAAWRRPRDALAAWLLLAAVALSGASWHDLRWYVFSQREIAGYSGIAAQPACLEAIACEAPKRLPAPRFTALRPIPAGERSRLKVQPVSIRDGTTWLPAGGVCQLSVEVHRNPRNRFVRPWIGCERWETATTVPSASTQRLPS